jgi:DNA-binding protein H-NS
MNIKELKTEAIVLLINELQSELKSRVKKEKENFLNTIKDKADFFGVSVEDLMIEASQSKKRKTGKVKPKYQNPDNQAETWTGRGRKPNWLIDQLNNGKELANMLIS